MVKVLTMDEHKDLVNNKDADYCACCGGLYQIAGLVEAQMPDLNYAPIIDHHPLQGGFSVCYQCSDHCEQGPCEPKKLVAFIPVTNEQLLALARKVQSEQSSEQWSDLDQDEHEHYQDWCKQLLAALFSPEVRGFIARLTYDREPNSPPTYDLAGWLVQNNYKMAVASMIEHFVWQPEKVEAGS
jgi:hypothetical protein